MAGRNWADGLPPSPPLDVEPPPLELASAVIAPEVDPELPPEPLPLLDPALPLLDPEPPPSLLDPEPLPLLDPELPPGVESDLPPSVRFVQSPIPRTVKHPPLQYAARNHAALTAAVAIPPWKRGLIFEILSQNEPLSMIPVPLGPAVGTTSMTCADAVAPLDALGGAVRKTQRPPAARTPPAMKPTVEIVAIVFADPSSWNPGEPGLVVHDTGFPLQADFALDQSEAATIPDTAPIPRPTTPAAPKTIPVTRWPRPGEPPEGPGSLDASSPEIGAATVAGAGFGIADDGGAGAGIDVGGAEAGVAGAPSEIVSRRSF